ncbi:hypothetical protein [Streptomyces sp. NPDC089919]|uniref:hypothetical protein n=1 Tax=Streptomyces sp. NPDC089919 TaxID=3155188 RepID=UPI003429A987
MLASGPRAGTAGHLTFAGALLRHHLLRSLALPALGLLFLTAALPAPATADAAAGGREATTSLDHRPRPARHESLVRPRPVRPGEWSPASPKTVHRSAGHSPRCWSTRTRRTCCARPVHVTATARTGRTCVAWSRTTGRW